MGVAIIGSVATAIYRATVELPSGLPGSASTVARDGLPSAVHSAGLLDGPIGEQLLVAAREAFVSGVHAAAVFGAAVFVAMGVASLAVFRQLRPYGEDNEPGDEGTAEPDEQEENGEPSAVELAAVCR